jgi:hypothetical protein
MKYYRCKIRDVRCGPHEKICGRHEQNGEQHPSKPSHRAIRDVGTKGIFGVCKVLGFQSNAKFSP